MVDINKVLNQANGNPGAMMFLMDLENSKTNESKLIKKWVEHSELKGTDLYVLYNDLCNKNIQVTHDTILAVPDGVLIDACKRQDYSGRETIKPYL